MLPSRGVAFDRHVATGWMSIARRAAIIPVIVLERQEVGPMYAVPVMGAPLRGTIARLR